MSEKRFEGKTALITGAASGMGLLTAQCFAAEGGNVLMIDISYETVKKCADEINSQNIGKALAFPCDVRNYEQVVNACKTANDTFGAIDFLMNIAGGAELRMNGIRGDNEFADTPIEVFDWGIDVNLKGQFYFAHAVMKYMREQKSGTIINFGSISGEVGCIYNVGYSVSKSGVMNGLTKSLARYGAKYNVRCVCVTPGPVLTRPGMAALETPLGRAAEPQELVDLVLYLASDKGSFMTGINVISDGGFCIK